MDRNEFIMQQSVALRREIESREARSFWIVVVGLLGFPLLSYLLVEASDRGCVILPFLVLVLIMLFIAQQNQMMRAGRYVRELLESRLEPSPGQAIWPVSHPELQRPDRYVSACFIVIFFAYYFLSIAVALHRLWLEAAADPSGTYWCGFFGASAVYLITTGWGLFALFHHWKSSARTAPGAREP
jgi:hypothetical protein